MPNARYVQWRARLRAADGAAPTLSRSSCPTARRTCGRASSASRRWTPGQILVPASFNPANQVFEPASPDRDGIFTTLEAAPEPDSRLKTLWKKGYRTLRWKVGDDNGDDLVFALAFRPADGAEDAWLPMVDDLDDDHYSFDATALPDGVYRFRLTASDRPDNGPDGALSAEQVSEPVVIDQSPPELAGVERRGDALRVTVADAWSPLRDAEWSADAAEWQPAVAADGLIDGRREDLVAQAARGRPLRRCCG